ncbi:MAG TPA: MlaD family protein [Planctomycetota bacterium]|nr:MlaD family protein [Planctomycetota bacterium]
MKKRRTSPVKIGAFVIGGLVILVTALLVIGSGRIFRRTHPFVSYFDGSVNGLRAGASVKFKGVEIGKVDRIRIMEGLTQKDQPIAVFFSLDVDKLDAQGHSKASLDERLQESIQSGLRSQLEADSMVTGILHVSLAFLPEAEAKTHDAIAGLVEIPTIPPPMQEIGAAVRSIVDRIGRYNFEKTFDSLTSALEAFTELSRSQELKNVLVSLDQTLKDVDVAVVDLRKHIDPLGTKLQSLADRIDAVGGDLQQGIGSARSTLGSVQALSDELGQAMGPLTESLKQAADRLQAMALSMQTAVDSTRVLLDPQAPLAVELRAGLREISDAARASRALFELLERNPGALLRGKSPKDGESK